jgi:hypothetical protein
MQIKAQIKWEDTGIKISGRPVTNVSNICVGRHIIRIIVALWQLKQRKKKYNITISIKTETIY